MSELYLCLKVGQERAKNHQVPAERVYDISFTPASDLQHRKKMTKELKMTQSRGRKDVFIDPLERLFICLSKASKRPQSPQYRLPTISFHICSIPVISSCTHSSDCIEMRLPYGHHPGGVELLGQNPTCRVVYFLDPPVDALSSSHPPPFPCSFLLSSSI